MHQVQTDHQIVAPNQDLMLLLDENGQTVVTATRDKGKWTIHADGVKDNLCGTRPDAIMAMTDHALAALPGSGYSTLVPHGLPESP